MGRQSDSLSKVKVPERPDRLPSINSNSFYRIFWAPLPELGVTAGYLIDREPAKTWGKQIVKGS
jgi:hypothetical protein